MVRVYRVLRVPHRVLGHMAGGTVVVSFAATRRTFLASRLLVTFQAARPIEIGSFGRLRLGVRIMAGAAPQAVSARSLTEALPELFKVAVHTQAGRLGAGPDKERRVVR